MSAVCVATASHAFEDASSPRYHQGKSSGSPVRSSPSPDNHDAVVSPMTTAINSLARCRGGTASTIESAPTSSVSTSPPSLGTVAALSKVVLLLDASSGVLLHKVKVPLPHPRASLKELAKASLKRFLTRFKIAAALVSVKEILVAENGVSLCMSDAVVDVVGPDESIVLSTCIANEATRADVVAKAAASVAAVSPTTNNADASSMFQAAARNAVTIDVDEDVGTMVGVRAVKRRRGASPDDAHRAHSNRRRDPASTTPAPCAATAPPVVDDLNSVPQSEAATEHIDAPPRQALRSYAMSELPPTVLSAVFALVAARRRSIEQARSS